jgi:hypothetical protein
VRTKLANMLEHIHAERKQTNLPGLMLALKSLRIIYFCETLGEAVQIMTIFVFRRDFFGFPSRIVENPKTSTDS